MTTFDIFTQGIKKRSKIQDDPSLDDDENFVIGNFIGFRIMIYCDECHDFLGTRSKLKTLSTEFKLSRYIKALEDIFYFIIQTKGPQGLVWYGQRYSESGDIEAIINDMPEIPDKGLDPYTFIYYIACYDVFNYINNNILVDFSDPPSNTKIDLEKQIIFGNENIPMLIHFLRLLTKEPIDWYDPETKNTLIEMYITDNENRPNRTVAENKVIKPYIESETMAFNISKMLIEDIFEIVAVPFSKILSCSYTLDIYTLAKYVYNLFLNNMNAIGDDNILYVNIDATQSGKNLLPIYSTLFDIKHEYGCKSIYSTRQTKLNRLITEANLYDPSPEDAIGSAMAETNIPQTGLNNSYNKKINILFAGVSIIEFMFTNEGNGTNLSLYRYFSDVAEGKVSKSEASVANISQQMVNTKDWTLAKFKTMGDFLQIILFELWQNSNPYRPKFSIFLTMDILCGRIASLITPYVVAELKIAGDVFSGLSMYLNEPDKTFLLDSLEEEQIEDIMGIISATDSELLQINDDLVDTLDPVSLDNLLREHEQTMTHFGKYKKSTRKQSPKKSTKKSNKKSTRKQSPKKTTKKQKYSEKVIKLSKKYNIKLDKNVVKNLKKLLSLQKKAKKLKLTITKKNSKGKRVYKTINELTKEIVKILKEKSKSKSTKSKSTKSKSTQKKVTKQTLTIREKAKKLKIKLTKRTSTRKRLYKTNNELMKEIKRKTK